MFRLFAKSIIRSKNSPSELNTDGQDAPNNNVHEFARYHWLKISNVERLICTSLTGFHDRMKAESELNKEQFRAMESSVGDDLDEFFKLLNGDQDLSDFRVLFFNQMLQSNDEYRFYRCTRFVTVKGLKTFIFKRLLWVHYLFIIFIIFIMLVCNIATVSLYASKRIDYSPFAISLYLIVMNLLCIRIIHLHTNLFLTDPS